jgi:hypothetical protein
MRFQAAIVLAASLIGASGCSADETHPPEYHPPADAATVDDPKSCAEIQAGEPSNKDVLLDGQVASCASVSLACPLGNTPSFVAACDGGVPVAKCGFALTWVLACELDAGLGDGGDDASSTADAASDATTD